MCGCTSTPCGCETPNIPRGPRGFAGPAGPAPNIEIGLVTTGAPGSPAAASITGTSPNLLLNLTIPEGGTGGTGPAGNNGQDATEQFTNLVSFTAPALNTSSVATVGDTSWMTDDMWLYIEGGGYFRVVNILTPTTVQLSNPGSNYFGVGIGWPSGIPGNLISTPVPSTATPNQVTPAAVPGIPGATGGTGSTGSPGQDALIQVVNTPPLAAPPPGQEFKIYTDSATNPTIVTGYSWAGGTWTPTVNLTPVAGSQIYQTTAAPLAGVGKNGDWAFSTTTLAVYYKSAGTWTNPFNLTATFTQVATNSGGDMGTVPVRTPRIVGFNPVASTFAAPTTYVMDLAYQAHHIKIDKNLILNWDDTNFPYSGVWELQVENTDPGAINIILTAGQFAENAGLVLPTTILLAGGDTRAFVFRKNMVGDRLIIENTYLVNNL